MTQTDRGHRRDRILKAALSQAVDGYDAVQMRAVADSAGVSPSTVYHFFPSKDDLLLECLHHWLTTCAANTAPGFAGADDPHGRLMAVGGSLTAQLPSTPRLADALARAYVHADGLAAGTAELVRDALVNLFAEAMAHAQAAGHEHHRQVAGLVADVWLTNVLAIAQGRTTAQDLQRSLARTVSIIARNTGGQAPAHGLAELAVLGA